MTPISRRTALLAVGATTLPRPARAAPRRAHLYKEPQCDCCESYAEYLRRNGFEVVVTPTAELDKMSLKAGIPAALQGCHLTMLDGYAVSGHVPIQAVRKLLVERPALAGITLPGMPAGSPGMGGQKSAPFLVYAIAKDGSVPVSFAVL